jgi:ribosomal protein S18 acetylase RimI-like enzyme
VKVILRNYRPDDFEALYHIDQSCYSSDVAYSRTELRTYLAFPGSDIVVAEIQKHRESAHGHSAGPGGANDSGAEAVCDPAATIIGFCVSIHRGDAAHIITMDVLKDWRRRGIGTALLAEIEKRLARKGVHHVELETATDNAAGIAFWRRHGYQSRGVKRGYYPRGVDAYAMAKSLAMLDLSDEDTD